MDKLTIIILVSALMLNLVILILSIVYGWKTKVFALIASLQSSFLAFFCAYKFLNIAIDNRSLIADIAYFTVIGLSIWVGYLLYVSSMGYLFLYSIKKIRIVLLACITVVLSCVIIHIIK